MKRTDFKLPSVAREARICLVFEANHGVSFILDQSVLGRIQLESASDGSSSSIGGWRLAFQVLFDLSFL